MAVQDDGRTSAPEDKGTSAPQDTNEFRKFALAHPTLLVSVAAALLFAIRLVAASGGDPLTASILLAQTSLGDVIRALLLPATISLAFLAMFALSFAAGLRAKGVHTFGFLAGGAIAALFGTYLSGDAPTGWAAIVLTALLVPLFLFGIAWLFRFGGLQLLDSPGLEGISTMSRDTKRKMLIVTVLLLVLWGTGGIVGSSALWLPRERLRFAGEKAFTGYVLKSSEGYLTIMNAHPRVIFQKKMSNLRERGICYYEEEGLEEAFKEAERVMPLCP
jgi:hypothetical protein